MADPAITGRTFSNIKTEYLTETSRLVEKFSKIKIPSFYPITGSDAFSFESDLHISALSKNSATYEPMDPSIVGNKRKFYLGKSSGINSIKILLENCGIHNVSIDNLQKIKEHLINDSTPVSEEDIVKIYNYLMMN